MSHEIPFYLVNSFTTEPFAGNPAGVFLDCDDLDAETMRRLAAEVSLESAFVMRPTSPDCAFRMRYFTAATEIPFCGHDTVAAGAVLEKIGCVTAGQEFGVEIAPGRVGVCCHRTAGEPVRVELVQRPPDCGAPLDADTVAEVADALGIPIEAITRTDLPVRSISTGSPFLFVPVTERRFVDAAPASFAEIDALSRRTDTHGLYVFAIEHNPDGALSVWSRNFCPRSGLNEDPVTGSASGALGGYLWEHGRLDASGEFAIAQGFGGGRGGTAQVTVNAEGDRITAIHVSGSATILSSGTFSLS